MMSAVFAPAAFAPARTPSHAARSCHARPCRAAALRVQAHAQAADAALPTPPRRQALLMLSLAAASPAFPALAADGEKLLCDAACAASLESKELVTLPSGLQYRDIVVGKGPTPVVGFMAVVDYVAMTGEGRIFENSLEKGKPYDIRIATGDSDNPASTIAGLNEGLKTMQPGGIRRLYIPGPLGFPKGLASGPGRPRVPPLSPLIFDVKLLLLPGIEDFDA